MQLKKPTFIIGLIISVNGFAQLTKVSSGIIKRFADFHSWYVQPRNIDVWLPENYDLHKKYAVLYMHDGQMLFDSTQTWNGQAWNVASTISKLINEKKIEECIIVGIWNVPSERQPDYLPQKAFELLSKQQQDSIYSSDASKKLFPDPVHADNYLKFLVYELKPFIDSSFSTNKDQQHTFIAGSSMGGLISMYAICEFPNVFGGAACLSTHWPGIFVLEHNPIPSAILKYFDAHIPSPSNHKLYFDHGTKTLDAVYAPFQLKADSIAKVHGYTDKNFMSKVFEGDDHSERSWSRRFSIPSFLLGNN